MTSLEHPDGIYHAHKEYHNIKKEAIGLIEAGGMFILPARLKRQLTNVSLYLQNHEFDVKIIDGDMLEHKDMILRLVEKHGVGHSLEVANNIVKLEIERICRNILYNTAVYKEDDGFINFLLNNDLKMEA